MLTKSEFKRVKITKKENGLVFSWGDTSEEFNFIMHNEYQNPYSRFRKAMYWVEEVKKQANWKRGIYLDLNVYSSSPNMYSVTWTKTPDKIIEDHIFGVHKVCDMIIDPKGYCRIFANEELGYVIPDSVYNAYITEYLSYEKYLTEIQYKKIKKFKQIIDDYVIYDEMGLDPKMSKLKYYRDEYEKYLKKLGYKLRDKNYDANFYMLLNY